MKTKEFKFSTDCVRKEAAERRLLREKTNDHARRKVHVCWTRDALPPQRPTRRGPARRDGHTRANGAGTHPSEGLAHATE